MPHYLIAGNRVTIRTLRKLLPLKAWETLYAGHDVQVSGNRYVRYLPISRKYIIVSNP